MAGTLQVVEPATEAVLEEIPRAGAEEVDAAVARARAAYPAWRAVAPPDRARVMHRLAAAPPAHPAGLRPPRAPHPRGARHPRQADGRRARRDGLGRRPLPLLRGGPRAAARRHDPGRR